jgi:hypothetical protein
MRSLTLVLPVLLAAPQVQQYELVRPSGTGYGSPSPVELAALADAPAEYEGENVVLQGTLKALAYPRYWTIEDGGARVLVIPGKGLDAGALTRFTGVRVEARGIARALGPYDPKADKTRYPDLPERPRGEPGWPQATVTVHALFDAEGEAGGRAPGDSLAALVRSGGVRPGTDVTVTGVFRGRNLFADLPEDSRRGADDWVVKDGAFAAWVVGKRPAGKGFALDLASRGDARWRVAVAGKLEVQGGVPYLRASSVTLAGRAEAEGDAPPPD